MTTARTVMICLALLIGSNVDAAQVIGELDLHYQGILDSDYFGLQLSRGDIVRVGIGYSVDSPRMDLLEQVEPEWTSNADFVHRVDGSYEMDFLILELDGTIVELPEPTLSLFDSSFEFLDCVGPLPEGPCFPTVDHASNMFFSSPLDEFVIDMRVRFRPEVLGDPIPVVQFDLMDLPHEIGAAFAPNAENGGFQVDIGPFVVVPEPRFGMLTLIAALFCLSLLRDSHSLKE